MYFKWSFKICLPLIEKRGMKRLLRLSTVFIVFSIFAYSRIFLLIVNKYKHFYTLNKLTDIKELEYSLAAVLVSLIKYI